MRAARQNLKRRPQCWQSGVISDWNQVKQDPYAVTIQAQGIFTQDLYQRINAHMNNYCCISHWTHTTDTQAWVTTQEELEREQQLQRNAAEMKFICCGESQHCMWDSLDPLLIPWFYWETLLEGYSTQSEDKT